MKNNSLIVLFFFLLSLNIFPNPKGISKRFVFLRNAEGILYRVKDKSIIGKFSIKKYLDYLKNKIISERSRNSLEDNYEQEIITTLFGDDSSLSARSLTKDQRNLVDGIKKTNSINFHSIFTRNDFKTVMAKLEIKVNDILLKLDPSIIASPNDPKFFYHSEMIRLGISKIINFAGKRLSSIPVLNTAIFIIQKVEDLLIQRRTYHQNILLHFIENSDVNSLDFSHDEANMIMSSIYESRLGFGRIFESRTIENNWKEYGFNKFFTDIRFANKRLRRYKSKYDKLDGRINFAFQIVRYNGVKQIINLFDTHSTYQKYPSVAYDFGKPELIARKRLLYMLGELGLSFVPLPSFIKSSVKSYISSMYYYQSLREGALLAYFETTTDEEILKNLKLQYLNPFEFLL